MKTLIPAPAGRHGSPSKCGRRDRSGCGITLDGIATTRRRTAIEFFTAGTSRLLAVEEQAGVGHHVVLSIVGVDKVDSGYYVGKRRQGAGPRRRRPGDGLAATQFHEFAGQILDWRWGLAGAVATVLIQILAIRVVLGDTQTVGVVPATVPLAATAGSAGAAVGYYRAVLAATRAELARETQTREERARRHAARNGCASPANCTTSSGTLWPRSACRPPSACT